MKFTGARDLAKFLAGSEEVHAAFAEQLFHHLVQQPVRAYGPDKLDRAAKSVRRERLQHAEAGGEIMATAALACPRTENEVA